RLATQLLVVAEHGAHAPGEAADPVAHRHFGQHLLLQVHGRVAHPAAEACWAKSTAFAGEGHQLRVPAAAALELEAASLQKTASQVRVELLLDELGQASLLGHPLSKLRPVLGHTLIERRVFGPASGVTVLWQRPAPVGTGR